MAKKKVKAITRLQRFLAAIAGDAVALEPVTNEEKLLYNIAEKLNEQTPSGSGGVLVVTADNADGAGSLNKTWQEITAAMRTGGAIIVSDTAQGEEGGTRCFWVTLATVAKGAYHIHAVSSTSDATITALYVAPSASGYPTMSE